MGLDKLRAAAKHLGHWEKQRGRGWAGCSLGGRIGQGRWARASPSWPELLRCSPRSQPNTLCRKMPRCRSRCREGRECMKVRRRPASFPRGRGTAVGVKAGHTGSVQPPVWWGGGQVPRPLSALPEVREEIPWGAGTPPGGPSASVGRTRGGKDGWQAKDAGGPPHFAQDTHPPLVLDPAAL